LATIAALTVPVGSAAEDWPDEAARLVRALEVGPTDTVAEIGAGRGELTIEMARLVPDGRVISTEIDTNRLEDIQGAVAKAGLRNVSTIKAGERSSNLPEGCCAAVYMREVYHHFDQGPAIVASIHRALEPGGMLAVIDFPERGPVGATCHCIPKKDLIEQVTAQGFDVVSEEDRWSGSHYLVVFRKR
jgi:ubiquinone/menaquinone biosynthesis C-methylase UbiE